MPQFQAIITTHTPNKKGERKFEVTHRTVEVGEYPDEKTAREEFTIMADSQQRARRAHTKRAVTCRFELLKQKPEPAK